MAGSTWVQSRLAARSTSPAARACVMASSMSPCRSCQRLARECSARTLSGSERCSSARSISTNRRWKRYQLFCRSSGDDEPVGVGQPGQHRPGVLGLQHVVAQLRVDPAQHGGADQEACSSGRELREQLVTQVVGDDAVCAGELLDGRLGAIGAGPKQQRGKVEPSRPALGTFEQRCHVRRLTASPRLPPAAPVASTRLSLRSAVSISSRRRCARSWLHAKSGASRATRVSCDPAGRLRGHHREHLERAGGGQRWASSRAITNGRRRLRRIFASRGSVTLETVVPSSPIAMMPASSGSSRCNASSK